MFNILCARGTEHSKALTAYFRYITKACTQYASIVIPHTALALKVRAFQAGPKAYGGDQG